MGHYASEMGYESTDMPEQAQVRNLGLLPQIEALRETVQGAQKVLSVLDERLGPILEDEVSTGNPIPADNNRLAAGSTAARVIADATADVDQLITRLHRLVRRVNLT